MNFQETLEYLYALGHETLAIKFGLASTRTLLASLNDPQHNFLKIQIAGTNGKGSTAAFLDAICVAAGIEAGLFTSPHLIDITERIRLCGADIDNESFGRSASTVRQAAEQLCETGKLPAVPTFFEQLTVIALCAFDDAKVKVAILETGLGGRLDSTTAAAAEIAVITPVDFDHQEYLGDRLEDIASEKAAIIDANSTAIIAPQNEVALKVILSRCESLGVAPILLSDNHWSSRGATNDGRSIANYDFPNLSLENVQLGLRGRHQISNAGTAVAAALEIRNRGFPIPNEAIRTGLENARHPGRLELFSLPHAVLLDGAHNPHGARALADYLEGLSQQFVTLIFGAMRDKDIREVLRPLVSRANRIVLTPIDNPRSASVNDLLLAVKDVSTDSEVIIAESASHALEIAFHAAPKDSLICVAGSLYLVGEARKVLLNLDQKADR